MRLIPPPRQLTGGLKTQKQWKGKGRNRRRLKSRQWPPLRQEAEGWRSVPWLFKQSVLANEMVFQRSFSVSSPLSSGRWAEDPNTEVWIKMKYCWKTVQATFELASIFVRKDHPLWRPDWTVSCYSTWRDGRQSSNNCSFSTQTWFRLVWTSSWSLRVLMFSSSTRLWHFHSNTHFVRLM